MYLRLSGIALESFASGLGEITYLQFSTRFAPHVTTECVGWFSCGTGAAGLCGALAWWIVKPLGVRMGLNVLSVLSFGTSVAFFFILPRPTYTERSDGENFHPEHDGTTEVLMQPEANTELDNEVSQPCALSFPHKMSLLRPMLWTFIIPLVTVYFAEYTINQGIVRVPNLKLTTGPDAPLPCSST